MRPRLAMDAQRPARHLRHTAGRLLTMAILTLEPLRPAAGAALHYLLWLHLLSLYLLSLYLLWLYLLWLYSLWLYSLWLHLLWLC